MRALRLSTLALLLASSAAFAQFEGAIEMKMTGARASGTTKALVSKVGTRTEMDMHAPEMQRQGMGGGMKMVSIVKFAEPDIVTFLNDSNKTYTVYDLRKTREQAGPRSNPETYTVKKLGKDSVAGYSCQNFLATGSQGRQIELCVTGEILGGGAFIRSLQRRSADGGSGLMKALADAGADGYPVRWVVKSPRSEDETMTMELVSAKRQAVPASTFEVPAGYTKSETGMMMSNPEMDRKMKEAMEKMTPEQRKAFEEMMKQRKGGQ